jgi:tetratricopeptide (TPR) repeat protein
MTWPASKTLHWRAVAGAIQPKLMSSGSGNELLADLTNTTMPNPPDGAPSRFRLINAVEISEFKDWASVSRAFAPYYEAAIKLGPNDPVKALAAGIARATTDPVERAELALRTVQEQIRYLYLGMDGGGYVPAAAGLTWTRRFGDCKAKTVLLTALLRELGIAARPVLVSTERGDLVAEQLPMMRAFDHAIVEARINGRGYWLDGTRLGDVKLAQIETPAWHVGLPVVDGGAGLVPLIPEPLTHPSETISLALDATAGIDVPAKAQAEMRFRGQSATDMRVKYADMSATDRDTALRKLWHDTYDFVTPATVAASDDTGTGDFRITLTGSAKMDWTAESGLRYYELDRARLGWKFNIVRDGEINQDAPFAFDYPDFWENRETIVLPAGGKGFKLQGSSVDETVGGLYAFHRKIGLDAGVVSMEASTRALTGELPASSAKATYDAMAAMADEGIFVKVPGDYMQTDQEIAALGADKLASSTAWLKRAAQRVDQADYKGSLADADAALALAPNLAPAWSVKALALARTHDNTAAAAAADHALALDAKQDLAWLAKGLIDLAARQYDPANKDFSAAIAIRPDDAQALAGRAAVGLAQGRYAEALTDFDAALALSPEPLIRGARASALFALGRKEEAHAEIDRAITALPDNDKLRSLRAAIDLSGDHPDAALGDLTWLIDRQPSAALYLERASAWPTGDRAHRDADVDSAIKLDPRNIKALATRAHWEIEAGNFAAADADLTAADAVAPDDIGLSEMRGQLLQRQGRMAEALAIADRIVARHPDDAQALNDRCWMKATANLQFDTALADCDAALKLAPTSAAILDSRAFVLLRMGRNDDAIAQYGAALKIAPRLANSLFGRAIARDRLGAHADAMADLADARSIAPDIDGSFARYGISLPADLAPAAPGAPAGAKTGR